LLVQGLIKIQAISLKYSAESSSEKNANNSIHTNLPSYCLIPGFGKTGMDFRKKFEQRQNSGVIPFFTNSL